MNLSIAHPTGRPNFSEVTVGDLTIWFSYETPVAFMYPGYGRVVSENDWGPTTGGHLNYIDHRYNRTEQKKHRVHHAEMLDTLDRLLHAGSVVVA